MFCFKCGKEIEDFMRFCPGCGTNLEKLTVDKSECGNQEEIIETPDIEFSVVGRKLYFTQEFIDYNTLRKRFFDKATELESAYIKYHTNREHTFNGLFEEEIPEVVYKTIDAVKFGVSVLMEYGIDDIDDEELSKMVSSDESIKEALGYIFEKADDINRFAENLGNYRDIKRAGRSYWEGGGFGVGGAIKGAITAGAFNLGTNIFRGIGDSITNASDKAKISKMKKDLANDKRVFECLHNTVFEYSLKVFDCVEEILIEEEIIPEFEFDFKKAEARANNYIKQYNIQKSEVVYNKTIDIICECINDCPYSVDLYYHLYNLINGNKDGIHDLAKYFGLERDYKYLLIKGDTNWINTVKSWDENTVDEIDKKITELESVQKDNIYIQINQDIESLKRKKEQLNIQKTSAEKINIYKTNVEEAISNNNIEKLWDLVEINNPYAEEMLLSYYSDLCKSYRGTSDAENRINELLSKVIEKSANGNNMATFIVSYINDTIHIPQSLEFIKRISEEDKLSAPLYYIGYFAIKKRTPGGEYWNTDNNTISKREALIYITKAAHKLFPPALSYLSELYKYGKVGFVQADAKWCEHYTTLSNAYKYTTSGNEPADNDTLEKQLSNIKEIRVSIDQAINDNNIDYVWQEIENKNVYAEYALKRYYKSICEKAIDNYNLKEMERLMSDVQKRAIENNLFANYLINDLKYEIHSIDKRNPAKKAAAATEIINISKADNVSALFTVGFWGIQGYNNATSNQREGLCLLEKAAKSMYPYALYWLGKGYIEGKYTLPKDNKMAEYYFTLASAFGLEIATRELQKLKATEASNSNGCFITSAVCKSFGKPDDCYELTTFRAFRDNWLSKQSDGKSLIEEYYKIAPIIVKNINSISNSCIIYRNIWDNYLNECLTFIENKKYEQCKLKYCEMINYLKNIYYTRT